MLEQNGNVLMKALQQIINAYQGRVFRVKTILRDRQYEFIRKAMETQARMACPSDGKINQNNI